MGMIALNILADVLYDLLKQDKPNLCPRSDCDITYLYSEHRKLNKHIPSNSWGGTWQRIQTTDIAIGDDIERIRLMRNELQHSMIFKLDETRFHELSIISRDLLKRLDRHNTPTRLYTDELNEILAKTISAEEVKSIENEILERNDQDEECGPNGKYWTNVKDWTNIGLYKYYFPKVVTCSKHCSINTANTILLI
ncbi:unnamed protein product [Mytilus coruscus]|uniref:DZIP3-like HEPN domain-containing protein n=1 Tax=Mytilus coruscus TaxID=42192 RepID=A0A6J8A9I2_MYTCO|nr:unnamed protein product [Mytilus coruscus]